ncbi:hypothetical protein ANN_26388 [Periplaneta americana]|uniref:Uncharacterized protein n=1 Tax=Periplaneta americana TaxID=6978 RepID=A0ABQ8RY78_PERAM|nr:hypothetical protein ANN_26388 [Periplaneta americana]
MFCETCNPGMRLKKFKSKRDELLWRRHWKLQAQNQYAKTVTGITYLDMLQNWLFPQLEDDSDDFIFMEDGDPPHFSNHVRCYLNDTIPGRWIGRGGREDQLHRRWPPRSLSLQNMFKMSTSCLNTDSNRCLIDLRTRSQSPGVLRMSSEHATIRFRRDSKSGTVDE